MELSPTAVFEHIFEIQWQYLLSQIVGFLVLAYIMWRFGFKPISGILVERQERIRRVIEDAQRQRDEITRLERELEERLSRIEEERRQEIQKATQDAYRARDEIIHQARGEAERILTRAREEIEREGQKLMVELRDFVADLAVLAAEKVIERNLNRADHHELINDVIEKELSGASDEDGKRWSGKAIR